jgi:molybdenum cofactor cytidylyltransferase
MIFGEFPSHAAEGIRLAHTLKLPHLLLRKGRVLSAADVAVLIAAGIPRVAGARLDPGEVDEDSAAQAVANQLAGNGITARPPYTGRCNLYAQSNGLLLVDSQRVDALNAISESITLGTLPRLAPVRKDQRIATVKIIPFAVGPQPLAEWRAASGDSSPLRIAPFRSCRAALIMSLSPGVTERMVELAVTATRSRLEKLGSALALELRCAHDSAAIGDRIGQALAAGCDLLLILGATISKDRGDVAPAAIVAAGGVIEHFGMPVEPGNMLLMARIGEVPVFNLPGCARSTRHNGLDILLQRLLAGLPLTPRDIMGLGVGGLIHSVEEDETAEPQAPVDTPPPRPTRIAALVLAAGRSTRMGERNKLLCPMDGIPLVRRVVNAACASRASQVMVVTGHQADEVEAALVDRPVSYVRNPDFSAGMSTSLRCGLRALPADTDGAIVLLADMPQITAADIDRLIAAFDPAAPAVLVPEFEGRRGNPVLWPRRQFAEMAGISGDKGARGLLQQYAAEVRTVPLPGPAILIDVDSPDDLQALTR